ncbi:MAG: hypothetical protein A4E65_02615 [Syntrophorhabdus sp. PtaU1.Bin153]|nr:MAG: hypothetical protein A4E65_02615 [Syntrophorhabdus sp. PtaU1.Bin153]
MIQGSVESRDVFLSHRGTDKPFVRRLAGDIEAERWGDRCLTAWLDEAEIRPGHSVPGMINYGLERSRFVVLVMTSAYFNSDSGWTDAEWHAALHTDPDNRQGRIIPIVAGDCPYVPMLLRHLLSLDLRGNNYDRDLRRLLAVLRNEPLPRPITHRGQLIRSNGLVDRVTLVAERAVPEGDPDTIEEKLSCNLLPVERMPICLYEAPIRSDLRETRKDGSERLPSKSRLKERIVKAQIDAGAENARMPAFRVVGDHVFSFHDLETDESVLATIVNQQEVTPIRLVDAIQDEDDRRLLVSLLNMSLTRHLMRNGLLIDNKRDNRFYFPPHEGKAREVIWKPFRNQTKRTVTKPYNQGNSIIYWLHQAAYIKVVFLASRFFLQITPTWLLTEDGKTIKGGPEVGRVVNRWVGRERNLNVLYHVRFWTSVLRRGPGPICVKVGEQTMDVSTVPAFVCQSYGIAGDQKDILEVLDEIAPEIALEEENLEVETYASGDEEDDFTDFADDQEARDD